MPAAVGGGVNVDLLVVDEPELLAGAAQPVLDPLVDLGGRFGDPHGAGEEPGPDQRVPVEVGRGLGETGGCVRQDRGSDPGLP